MDFFFAEVASIPPGPAAAAATPAATAAVAMPFRFLDLPPELRVLVYEELVVVGKVFFTPNKFEIEECWLFRDHDQYHRPYLSILRTCKAICEEAGSVYFGANTFVLPSEWPSAWHISIGLPGSHVLHSAAATKNVRHICVTLSMRSDYPLTMFRSDWDSRDQEEFLSFDQMTRAERLDLACENAHEWLLTSRMDLSQKISLFENLQSITLDFTNAYCPFGCCRVLDLDWCKALKHAKKICFFGISDEQERADIEDLWIQATEGGIGCYEVEWEVDDLTFEV